MESNTKRKFVVYNVDEAIPYLKSAAAFQSRIYIKKSDDFVLLEDMVITQVDSGKNFFFLNREIDPSLLIKQRCTFRILLEACIVDFTTTVTPSLKAEDKTQRFALPGKMTVQYIRKFMRIKPSKNHPVNVQFIKNRLTLKFSVLDISTSGLAVKVPRAEMLYEIGDVIDDMEIFLTEQDRVRLSGQIRAAKGDRCGIKFINCSSKAEELIAEYIDRRKLAEKIRARTYRDVEKELMMLSKKS